ncbi:PIN domain-containing protein [Candidatus Gottesmanbacteria bacterium]|nr:PIN domain-containing protein [Candidatus Gottesmanbacteria bacterium]
MTTTNFIIDETLTLLRVRSGLKIAIDFKEDLLKSVHSLKIVRVLVKDEVIAWNWFVKEWSGLSFTDCTSFAVMKRLGLTEVATFDHHFSKAGFKIVD